MTESSESPDQMSDEAGKKKEFLEQVRRTSEEAKRVEDLARKLQQSMYFVSEIAQVTYDVFSTMREEAQTSEEWSRRTQEWRGLGDSVDESAKAVTLPNSFWARAYGTATTSNTIMYSDGIAEVVEAPVIRAGQLRMSSILDRAPLLEKAFSEMHRLGLDEGRSGFRSPLDLLRDAHNSLGTGPTSPLLTIRQVIDTAVALVLQRQPGQEKTPGHLEKVVSLGAHCGRLDLEASHFSVLGTSGEALRKELSGAKDAALTSQKVSDLFHRALLYVNALLESLDEARLRRV